MKNITLLLALFGLFGCRDNTYHYIHVAHTRLADTLHQRLDPRIEQIDFGKFDMVLLGGDLCEETTKEWKTLEYLDTMLNLGSPNTLWALGNHDNAHNEFVEKITGRPIFYAYHQNGITFVVLYTQEEIDWKCTITGPQLELIKQVTDTISASSHLVVMTHKLVWIRDNPGLAKHQGKSEYDWSCNYMINRTNWNQDVLPLLQAVQKRGVQVLCLAGDIGMNVSEFDEKTEDGIVYLASGIGFIHPDSKILLFDHKPRESLTWRFVSLNDFLKKGQRM